jgi:hypothetical protein
MLRGLTLFPFSLAMLLPLQSVWTQSQRHFGAEERLTPGIAVRDSASCIQAADFDDNGMPDLALGSKTKSADAIWLQDTRGQWSQVNGSGLDVPARAVQWTTYQLLAADFQGDGHLDLLRCGLEYGGSNHQLQCHLFLGDGKGRFVRSNSFSASAVTYSEVQVADVDQDGRMDIVFVPGAPPDPYTGWSLPGWWRNEPGATLSFRYQGHMLSRGMICDSCYCVDLNQDGYRDLVFLPDVGLGGHPGNPTYARSTPAVFLGDAQGGHRESAASLGLGQRSWGPVQRLFDLDADGDLDYLFRLSSSRTLSVMENTGKGQFVLRHTGVIQSLNGYEFKVDSLDVESGPLLRIGVQAQKWGSWSWTLYEPAAGMAMRALPVGSWLPGGAQAWHSIAHWRSSPDVRVDIDGDGDLDLLYLGTTTTSLLARRGLERELLADAPKIGRSWTIELLHQPGRLARTWFGLLAISDNVQPLGIPLAPHGHWYLGASFVTALPSTLAAPAGSTTWPIPIPSSPAWLGQPLALQGILLEPKLGVRCSRAWSGRIQP